jgi:hypothetical protein
MIRRPGADRDHGHGHRDVHDGGCWGDPQARVTSNWSFRQAQIFREDGGLAGQMQSQLGFTF